RRRARGRAPFAARAGDLLTPEPLCLAARPTKGNKIRARFVFRGGAARGRARGRRASHSEAAFASALCRILNLRPRQRGQNDERQPSWRNALCHLLFAGNAAARARADVLLLPAANRRMTAYCSIPTVAVVHDLAELHVPRKYDALRTAYLRVLTLGAMRTAD